MIEKEMFFTCSFCGKKLIKRLPNGLWHFMYGRKKKDNGNLSRRCPVEIYINGSVRIKCMDSRCEEWNTFTYFPNILSEDEQGEKDK